MESSRVRSMEAASSKARHRKVDLEHTRSAAATEDGRRASDRAYFVRPLRADQGDLWQYGELRSWYGGGAGGGDAMAGDDFRAPPMGAALVQGGYSIPAIVARGGTTLGTSIGGANPHLPDAAPSASVTLNDAINAARTSAQGETRRALRQAHWTDRDALVAVGTETSRRLLAPTGYASNLVATSRPFKDRPAADDTWRFNPPPPNALKETFVTSRVVGARDAAGNSQRTKDTKNIFSATDTRNYW